MERKKSKMFTDLIVWQKAHIFVLAVYKHTKSYPNSEQFGIISQFRRAAVSIAANIAEGYRKTGTADKLRFMNMAHTSLEECRYYIILSKDLDYIDEQINIDLINLIEDVSKLLSAYCKAITGVSKN